MGASPNTVSLEGAPSSAPKLSLTRMHMNSSNLETKKSSPENDGAFAAWGALIGAAIGALAGYLADWHWLIAATIVGGIGLLVGALIDRSRR